MQLMRETWTDERLDDLNERVADGFRRMDARFDSTQAETNSRFNSMQADVNARFDSMQRMMLQGFIAIFATMITGFVGLAGLIVF